MIGAHYCQFLSTCRNAYDINRQQLVDQVTRMRANFLQSNVIGTRLQDQGMFFLLPLQFSNFKEQVKLLMHIVPQCLNKYNEQAVNLLYFVFSESLHNVAIGTMGNYQDYLKRMPSPLREIENTPVRQHMFGNPFKVNKVRRIVPKTQVHRISSVG